MGGKGSGNPKGGPGRNPLPEEARRRGIQKQIRWQSEEVRLVQAAAHKQGISFSELVRGAAMERAKGILKKPL